MKVFSTENQILNYFAKWEENKQDPTWLANPNVQRVLTDGEIDLEKLKPFFEERGICTQEEFDTQLKELKKVNLFTKDGAISAEGIAKYEQVKTDHKADLYEIDRIKNDMLEAIKNKEY